MQHRKRERGGWAVLVLAAALAGGPVSASDVGPGWHVQLTPYLWGSGLGGRLTPFAGAPTLRFDKSLGEVLEDLDSSFSASAFARRDRLVLLGDFSHSRSSRSGSLPGGVPAAGRLRQTSYTLAAGYRSLDSGRSTLDVLGGLRRIDVRGSVEVPPLGIDRSPTIDATIPVVGLRWSHRQSSHWSTLVHGDLGVFNSSKRTAQLLATANYHWREHTTLSIGYRQLDIDVRDGATRLDVRLAGPLVGLTWGF